jgi:serine/threonine protein kinase
MAIATQAGGKTPAAPRAVGRYELREKLGEGGMGVVWRALDTKTGGEVAIKIMKDISDPAALELFAKEWKALAEMSHPNIVDVRDVDVLMEDKERKPFFVMPLLRGSTLSDLIKKSSERLTVSRVVEILSQVCRGLQAAHQKGLIHRDLKPSNIFVMDDDTAKVIDFGVVYLAGTHSVTGQKGTYQYMSPEQVQMKEVTPASDIFSLGVILYEALTARKPFAHATAEETMQAVLKRVPPPVSDLNPAISHSVSQVVHKCLAKQPIHRFSSARELSETLQKAARNEPVFDPSKLRLRVERAKSAFKTGDEGFASELLSELESEGHLDPEITVLRLQIDMAMKHKKIRQLMESARARIEQDEIPLGLDKLRELLELDPENSDALALKTATEKTKGEAQAGKWIDLANTHLGNWDFAAARHAAEEALASRAGDSRALALLSRIDNLEIDARRIREQKEQLYNTAMRAYQNGEIDSALSRLVRLFSVARSRPEGTVPERDAVYESFYKEVRSEHDSIRLLLEEAQHEFSEENFTHALDICVEHLKKYPNDGPFQALKIQIEDAERQKVSAYIAMVSRNVDAEPDLDRRASILREACERYPGEAQFAQQLKVVRERRDLVNSIVAKAHQFGERCQYSEELSQWDMLRNIHPRYPGLAFELEQCKKKRDQQAQDEEKAHLVEEIVRLMDMRDYAKALEQTKLALLEFPADTELIGLEKLSKDGLERSQESNRLFETGQAEAAVLNWVAATDLLQKALRLDPRNAAVKDALIAVLTEQGRGLLESDWSTAKRLHQEAGSLDANHRAVRSLGIEISEARRQTYVGECLTEARAMVAAGDSAGAYERILEGRKEYPKDVRLEQFEISLQRESKELQLRQERRRRLEELAAAQQHFEREPDSDKARNVLKISRELSAHDPDNPDTLQSIAEAEQTVKRVRGTDDLDTLLSPRTDVSRMTGEDDAETRVFEPKAQNLAPKRKLPTMSEVVTGWMLQAQRRLSQVRSPRSKVRNALLALISSAAVIVIVLYLLRIKPPPPPPPPPPGAKIHLSATPSDSLFRVNGAFVSGGDVNVPAGKTVAVEASRPGYSTKTIQLDDKSKDQNILLEPLPLRLNASTGEKSGFIEVDGSRSDLVDGSVDGLDIPSDGKSHTLVLSGGGKQLANLEFQANPGERPHLSPINSKDLIIISSFGPAATIYGGERLKNVALGEAHPVLSNAGTDLPPITGQSNELTYLDGTDAGTLTLSATEWPSLTLQSLAASSQLTITSNVESAVLTANGSVVKRGRHGWRINQPGNYAFVLSADNYVTQTWTVELKQRQTLSQDHKLELKVVQPTLAALLITGGTPGAQVKLDGRAIGDLDASGAARYPASLSAGTHQLLFHKDGFCDSTPISFSANPPADARQSAVKLDPCGSLTLQAIPQDALVRVRKRAGEANTDWTTLMPGRKTILTVGAYEVDGELAGNRIYNAQIKVEAGQNTEVAPHFIPLEHCQLQNPADVTRSGAGMMKAKAGGSALYLIPGCVNVDLAFAKPKPGIFTKGKVEWVIEAGGSTGRIEYELDEDGNIYRKSNVNGVDSPKSSLPKLVLDKSNLFDVRIRIEGSHIRITTANDVLVDDYSPKEQVFHDLSNAKIGIKTKEEFSFKPGSGF